MKRENKLKEFVTQSSKKVWVKVDKAQAMTDKDQYDEKRK